MELQLDIADILQRCRRPDADGTERGSFCHSRQYKCVYVIYNSKKGFHIHGESFDIETSEDYPEDFCINLIEQQLSAGENISFCKINGKTFISYKSTDARLPRMGKSAKKPSRFRAQSQNSMMRMQRTIELIERMEMGK
jgi:hypothetical protein